MSCSKGLAGMTTNVLSIDGPAAALDVVGGKGRSLSEMCLAGLPVPGGFHVTTSAYRGFVTHNRLQSTILERVAGDDASDAIAGLFAESEIDDAVADEIVAAYRALGERPAVAVRSSANAEDLPDMSFAGQQDTYLNVIGEQALLAAVKDCWASLWTPRAIAYRDQMGIGHDQVAMAVVVQLMVDAHVSGILFTANPMTGERNDMIANASYGLGEAIVSGQVTPDTYTFDRRRRRVVDTVIGTKEKMIFSDGEGGTLWQEVSKSRRTASCLSEDQLTALADLAVKSEQHFGMPQDIEWAIGVPDARDGKGENPRLFLLQSRPITNLPPPPLKDLEWEPPAPGVLLLRRQVVENMPDPLSPLFDELYLSVGLQQGMNRSLARSGAPYTIEDMTNGNVHLTVNGYAYQRRDFKAPEGVDPKIQKAFLVKETAAWWTEKVDSWRNEWLPEYRAFIAEKDALDIGEASDAELLQWIRELANEDAYYWEESSKVFANAKVTDEQLQDFLKTVAPGEDLTSGMFLSGFESRTMRAQLEVWEMAKLIRADESLAAAVTATPAAKLLGVLEEHSGAGSVMDALRRYNATYGHQIYSLDFVEPTACEDLSPVMVALKAQVADPDYDPSAHHAEVAEKRKAAMRRIREVLTDEQMWQFRWYLWKARRFYPYREEVVFWLGAAWPTLRKMVRALGQRLVDAGTLEAPDDLYYLKTRDIEKAIEARADGKGAPEIGDTARAQRELREARKRIHPPGAIPLDQHDNAAATQKLNTPDSSVMSGFAVSPGKIEGEVSVILSPAEFHNMKPNTILVCPMTTPAWTQLFSHAIALVTDIGSILAHGSIVAREFGIPAVLGLGNVTQRLESGQRVRVDGDAGIVEILE
jgi:pyruvate,water dikinase